MSSKYGVVTKGDSTYTTPKRNVIGAKKKNVVRSEAKPEWEYIRAVKKKVALHSTPDCQKLISQRKKNEDMLNELEDHQDFLCQTI